MIWNPWRRVRDLDAQVRALEHALHQSTERYDRIRDMNHELRRTLGLYRSE